MFLKTTGGLEHVGTLTSGTAENTASVQIERFHWNRWNMAFVSLLLLYFSNVTLFPGEGKRE